jgi:hypothetical protein
MPTLYKMMTGLGTLDQMAEIPFLLQAQCCAVCLQIDHVNHNRLRFGIRRPSPSTIRANTPVLRTAPAISRDYTRTYSKYR